MVFIFIYRVWWNTQGKFFGLINYWDKTQISVLFTFYLVNAMNDDFYYTNYSKISIVWRSIINQLQLEHEPKACKLFKKKNALCN